MFVQSLSKRWTVRGLALVSAVLLVGCSSEVEQPEVASTTTNASQTATETSAPTATSETVAAAETVTPTDTMPPALPLLSEPPQSLEQGRYAPYGVSEDGQPRIPADAPQDVQCSIFKGLKCSPEEVSNFEKLCTDNPDYCAILRSDSREGLTSQQGQQ